MHVGWVGVVTVPERQERPTLAGIRRQFQERLGRAPRYRQKLATVPLGLHDPVWVDDHQFDIRRHVHQAKTNHLDTLVQEVFSTPLDRGRPLWELWIADDIGDGRIGFVGKVHHCLVDGLAAVEFASLLLDFDPEAHVGVRDYQWRPQPPPSSLTLLAEGVRDRIADELDLVRLPAGIARSPRRLFSYARDAQRVARALTHSLPPASRQPVLNAPLSPARCLGRSSRPFGDLQTIKSHYGATVNDVVLAVSAGAMRSFLEQRGQAPTPLKAMVPVSVRDEAAATGNAVSFVFIDLPCDEPDPERRLRDVQMAMADRKSGGDPAGGRTLVNSLGFAPHNVQHQIDRLVAGPGTFNLVVSNIPGPRERLYLQGCPMEEVYPVVPLSDRHALSIGFTTMVDQAFFGIYADRRWVPDPGVVTRALDREVEELLAGCG